MLHVSCCTFVLLPMHYNCNPSGPQGTSVHVLGLAVSGRPPQVDGLELRSSPPPTGVSHALSAQRARRGI